MHILNYIYIHGEPVPFSLTQTTFEVFHYSLFSWKNIHSVTEILQRKFNQYEMASINCYEVLLLKALNYSSHLPQQFWMDPTPRTEYLYIIPATVKSEFSSDVYKG